jgi:serine/threonine protein kinase
MGQEVNHQIDIYALGLVFYEILSGSRLYRFANDIEAIRTIPQMTIPPIITRRPDIPQGLNDIVMKCLEKSTVKRYQSALELHDDSDEAEESFGNYLRCVGSGTVHAGQFRRRRTGNRGLIPVADGPQF